MNTHNVNVKTAASESTETWVKKNTDLTLTRRTDDLIRLAKHEGRLMMMHSLSAMGTADDGDVSDDVCFAAELIRTMLSEGGIATPFAYELASSVRALADGLWPEGWDLLEGPDLPGPEYLQENAPLQREALRQSYIEAARNFGISVTGRMEFHEDDRNFGTYWCDAVVSLGRADSVAEAMELLVQADLNGDWQLSDYDALSFEPQIATITDLNNRVVLRGNARTLKWSVPEADPAVREKLAAQKAELLSQAAFEGGWDNYETARQLRQEAGLLDLTSVHAVWLNDPQVTDALKAYRHPSERLDETEIMENMAF